MDGGMTFLVVLSMKKKLELCSPVARNIYIHPKSLSQGFLRKRRAGKYGI